jgi:hypothetical protein
MDESLWTTEHIAKYLVLNTQHVRDRVVCQPGFPTAIRIPTTQGRARPRWKEKEVRDWADKFKEKKRA